MTQTGRRSNGSMIASVLTGGSRWNREPIPKEMLHLAIKSAEKFSICDSALSIKRYGFDFDAIEEFITKVNKASFFTFEDAIPKSGEFVDENDLSTWLLNYIEHPEYGVQSIDQAREIVFGILNAKFDKSGELVARLKTVNPSLNIPYPVVRVPLRTQLRRDLANGFEGKDGVVANMIRPKNKSLGDSPARPTPEGRAEALYVSSCLAGRRGAETLRNEVRAVFSAIEFSGIG